MNKWLTLFSLVFILIIGPWKLRDRPLHKKNQPPVAIEDIRGSWYLNKWTAYHTLIFAESTVFVDNNVDTVFTLNYSILYDSLITWHGMKGKKYKNKIIGLTKTNLILDGINGQQGELVYSRKKEKQ